jgi:sortase B
MFKSKNDMDNLRSDVIRDVSEITPELPDNPIDFDILKKRNDDIYGWIEIPNTQVNYPIVQSWEEDDSFYLDHNIDKQYDITALFLPVYASIYCLVR